MQTDGPTRAEAAARADAATMAALAGRRFALGTRPVIRWVKGDGRDDAVTRAAIGQATRLFGDRVDYCLCTNGLDAVRVRAILEWAVRPVEWWPAEPADNPELADLLAAAGCPPEHFGYWWKWFPERVRPAAPEWVLDGDMVVTAAPDWFDAWAAGVDLCRVTQDDRWPFDQLYGRYRDLVDPALRLYSGLVSLPPDLRYMPEMAAVIAERPLAAPHDGRRDMCEQGVIATVFQRLGAEPIPLYEFPFGRAFEPALDYGRRGDRGAGWGFHFGHAFRRENPHFVALARAGRVLDLPARPDLVARTAWLGAAEQWGLPGWSMADPMAALILDYARDFAGRSVLELGTSRGRLAAVLAQAGCRVTTIDLFDRGAARNLDGLAVRVVRADAEAWLAAGEERFDLVVCDLHGNGPEAWGRRGKLLLRALAEGGTMLLSNARLWAVPGWEAETGVQEFLAGLGPDWAVEVVPAPPPGLAVVARRDVPARAAATADADLRLWVEGEERWPNLREGDRHVFRLGRPVQVLRLRSRVVIPSRQDGSDDDRRLGVAVRTVRLTGPGFAIALDPDWTGFGKGFHPSEGNLRWSDGDGVLILPLLPTVPGPLTVEVVAYQHAAYPAPLPDPPAGAALA